mgnify:CR=1 FL=1
MIDWYVAIIAEMMPNKENTIHRMLVMWCTGFSLCLSHRKGGKKKFVKHPPKAPPTSIAGRTFGKAIAINNGGPFDNKRTILRFKHDILVGSWLLKIISDKSVEMDIATIGKDALTTKKKATLKIWITISFGSNEDRMIWSADSPNIKYPITLGIRKSVKQMKKDDPIKTKRFLKLGWYVFIIGRIIDGNANINA